MADSVREFFESLPSRVDPARAAEVTNSYLFDVEGAGRWLVRSEGGALQVSEGGESADCTISTSEDNFLKIMRGEQNPTTSYMTGKLKIKGDMGAAMKLQKLF